MNVGFLYEVVNFEKLPKHLSSIIGMEPFMVTEVCPVEGVTGIVFVDGSIVDEESHSWFSISPYLYDCFSVVNNNAFTHLHNHYPRGTNL